MRFTVVSLMLLSLIVLPAGAQNRTGEGEVKQLYDTTCSGCHGLDLAGGSGPSLIDDEWTHGSSDDAIAAAIRDGIPDTEMVAMESTLSDLQIRSLVIFLREMKMKIGQDQLLADLGGEIVSAAGHRYTLEELGRGDGILWSIAFLPNDVILVTQRDGVLWRFEDGQRTQIEGTPEVWQRGQGGLLEVAPHPNYVRQRLDLPVASASTRARWNATRPAGMTKVVRGKIVEGRWT